jgi:phage/conjugal plasmid C-4 type zinc finger TraR family protein
MADLIDQANEAYEQHLWQEILKARSSLYRESEKVRDGRCQNCGDIIPIARRKALPGCRRCLACQINAEKEQQLKRKPE